jgi:hypothetical protein
VTQADSSGANRSFPTTQRPDRSFGSIHLRAVAALTPAGKLLREAAAVRA